MSSNSNSQGLYKLCLPAADFPAAIARLKNSTDAAKIKEEILYHTDDGLTALHYACSDACPPELITLMLSKTAPKKDDALNINIASLVDDQSYTPLHYLCEAKGATLLSAKILIDQYPEAVVIKNASGLTPREVAVKSELPEPFIEMLSILTIDEIQKCGATISSIEQAIEDAKESKQPASTLVHQLSMLAGESLLDNMPPAPGGMSGVSSQSARSMNGRSRRAQSRNIFSLAASRRATSSRGSTREGFLELQAATKALNEKEATVKELHLIIAEKDEQIQELGEAGLDINEQLEIAESYVMGLQKALEAREEEIIGFRIQLENMSTTNVNLSKNLQAKEELIMKTVEEAGKSIKNAKTQAEMKVGDVILLQRVLKERENLIAQQGVELKSLRESGVEEIKRLKEKNAKLVKECELRKGKMRKLQEERDQESENARLLLEEAKKDRSKCCCAIC
jgi:hypothetical protein